jgi:hypothetical protein
MIRNHSRVVAVIVAVLASLTLGTSPAFADDGDVKTGQACWLNADTGALQCFADSAELADAVLAQTGGPLVRQADAAARPAGTLATFVIADLYLNISYGGGITSITSSSSTVCASGTVTGSLTGGANNTTSSFKSYLGCTTTLFDGIQSGTSYTAVNAPGLGAMNDKASSYSIT